MLDTLLPVLLFAALALAVLGAAKRFLMWRRGRPAKVDWIGGLMQMPRRYLVDLHHVVERDRYMSRTHVATAGGFVLAALLAILVHGFGLHGRILGFALLAATALMFVGALFVARRRLDPPSRLSKGPGCACRRACWRSPRASSSPPCRWPGSCRKASAAGSSPASSPLAWPGACPSCSSA